MKLLYFFILSSIILLSSLSAGKSQINLSKGININPSDSSFSLKFGLLLQPRFELNDSLNNCNCDNSKYTANAMLRRMRLRFEGFIGHPSLSYFFQLGVTNNDMESTKSPDGEISGIIYDAYMDWEFIDRTKLRVGQAKLPGAMSRLMSFTGLNFLERSNAEAMFNNYRDIGIQLHNEWNINDFTLREQIAVTQGEGVNQKTLPDDGFAYSGRLEILPFGLFENSGERYEMDMAFEKSPKLMIGAAVFCDNKAQRERAILGKALYQPVDITSYYADFLFKYSGFAIQGEYYKRQTPVPETFNKGNSVFVYVGEGFSGQASYMITDDMALALRYSHVRPDDEIQTFTGNRTDYSLGFIKFIFGNKVKLQSDISYIEQEEYLKELSKNILFRINMILSL
ncbi:porin [Bacteroidota bacterium]